MNTPLYCTEKRVRGCFMCCTLLPYTFPIYRHICFLHSLGNSALVQYHINSLILDTVTEGRCHHCNWMNQKRQSYLDTFTQDIVNIWICPSRFLICTKSPLIVSQFYKGNVYPPFQTSVTWWHVFVGRLLAECTVTLIVVPCGLPFHSSVFLMGGWTHSTEPDSYATWDWSPHHIYF